MIVFTIIANTTLLWGVLEEKYVDKKMQQHGRSQTFANQRYTFRSKLWPLQFCPGSFRGAVGRSGRGSVFSQMCSNDIKKLVNHFSCPKKTWPCRAIFDVVIYKHIYVYVGTCKRKHVLVRGFHFQPQKFPRCQFHSWKMLRKGAKNFVVSACNSSCAPP